jgi:hypothetical protein
MYRRSRHNQAFGRSPRTARTESFYLVSALPLAFRLLPYGLSDTSRSIGEALPNDAFDCPFGSLHVVHSESDAIAVSEIVLGKISVQMLLAAMLVDALHPTFEDRIEAFDGIGVDVAANVFLLTMVHALMAGELATNFKVLARLISHQRSFLGDVGADNRSNLRNGSCPHGSCGHGHGVRQG